MFKRLPFKTNAAHTLPSRAQLKAQARLMLYTRIASLARLTLQATQDNRLLFRLVGVASLGAFVGGQIAQRL